MPKSELFDFSATLIHETKLAYLLDDGANKVWLPKSQCEDNKDGTWTTALRLAKEKGLV